MVRIEVVYALADEQQLVELTIARGTSARDALIQALEHNHITLAESETSLNTQRIPIGIFGSIVADDYVMQEGDRLEIYRPLLQDPMERRRQIARQLE